MCEEAARRSDRVKTLMSQKGRLEEGDQPEIGPERLACGFGVLGLC